jgi:hypothetical protein
MNILNLEDILENQIILDQLKAIPNLEDILENDLPRLKEHFSWLRSYDEVNDSKYANSLDKFDKLEYEYGL